MKVSKGQSQPEIVAAAFVILYMVLDHFNTRLCNSVGVKDKAGLSAAFGPNPKALQE